MKKQLAARIAFVLLVGGTTLGLSTMSASAATNPTPTGNVGACNMLVSFLPSGKGMGLAMSTDNPQGNIGMFGAVAASGCS